MGFSLSIPVRGRGLRVFAAQPINSFPPPQPPQITPPPHPPPPPNAHFPSSILSLMIVEGAVPTCLYSSLALPSSFCSFLLSPPRYILDANYPFCGMYVLFCLSPNALHPPRILSSFGLGSLQKARQLWRATPHLEIRGTL